MHGVGTQWVERAFASFGFPSGALLPVASQSRPDPDFPSVRFPNPEEKGALDEAIKFASQVTGCSVIIANDPDADRLAVAEKCKHLIFLFKPLTFYSLSTMVNILYFLLITLITYLFIEIELVLFLFLE